MRAETDALAHSMLEEYRDLAKQGILVHRLRKMLKALQEDFKSNEAILKQHRPKIKKRAKHTPRFLIESGMRIPLDSALIPADSEPSFAVLLR